MAVTLDYVPRISAGATRNIAVDLTFWLDGNATLTGTPSFTEVDTAHLTLASPQKNSTAMTIQGRYVAINHAALCTVSGQQADTTYRVRVSVASTDSQVEVFDLTFDCV